MTNNANAREGLFVCPDCLGDDDLRTALDPEADECDFCGARATGPMAVPLTDLAAHILEYLHIEYEDPANSLPYDSREGGYQGTTYTTLELLRDEIGLELPRDDDGRLLEALAGAIDDLPESPQHWSEKDPFVLRLEERLQLSWRAFSHFVMHQRRFFFRQADVPADAVEDPERLAPDELLERIGQYAVDIELIERLPAGTRMYRARARGAGFPLTAAELGPPPPDKASQNRMSPAGISMLHAAEDPETAVTEISRGAGEYVVGQFVTTRDALILNLHDLPPVPGYFNELQGWKRRALLFLHAFAKEVSRPIARDGREHIEYVPTQLLTEYFETQVMVDGRPFDGVAFTSSRTGRRNYTLFVTEKNVATGDASGAAGDDRWVRFEGGAVERHD